MNDNHIIRTNFQFEGLKNIYYGKVRDVYIFKDKLAIIASDRISAFDVILPEPITFKGQVLNQISWFFMQKTKTDVPNWTINTPHPNVTIGWRCEPFPLEMVIRGYLAGSAWRAYQKGQRIFNGHKLPEGLRENDQLPYPIITPATKAPNGEHDEDINSTEILERKIVSPQIYEQLLAYTEKLFAIGTQIADKQGLILADTKYEFGLFQEKVYLIDELHTPDSSRYFDKEGFEQRQEKQIPQPQRSKEMVRKWLMENNFQGLKGQTMPVMPDEWKAKISQEYIYLYEQLTGEKFEKNTNLQYLNELQNSIAKAMVLQ